MVMGPVSCPAEIHCTTILPCKMPNFQGWGGGHSASYPLQFHPWLRAVIFDYIQAFVKSEFIVQIQHCNSLKREPEVPIFER